MSTSGSVQAGAATGPTATRLPRGFRVVLDRRVHRFDGGAALLGGAPPRLMLLAPAARALLDGGPITVTDPTSAALVRRLLDGGLAHPTDAPGRPGAPGPADVTVVIPVKDRLPALTRLLAALPAGLGGVIVVDDGSADPAALARAARAAGARVLRHATSRGPAAARNAGLAAATTELVAFLDSDVVPQPGWLEPLLARFVDPAVGLAAPRIVALPPVRGWIGRYEAVRSSLDLGPDPALVVPRSRVAYVPSAAMVVRRTAVGAGFDEGMHVAEDVDLVLRLHAGGWRLRYEPAARVAHDHRAGFGAWWSRKAYYGTGAAPLAQRHAGAVPPMVLSPWTAAVCALLLLQRRRATALAAVIGVVATDRLSRKLGRLRRPLVSAARLTGMGFVGAVAQTASAITRHYWPLALLGCLFSARARRAVLLAALAEGVWDWWGHRDADPGARPPGPLGYLIAHRLDDLAYGAGLWWGALRARTTAPLRPMGTGSGSAGQERAVRQG
ncbi:mycofactocin system glycosyltransferase [Pseudonocardia sp. K10HN5]|uniref:Mycofactocin system glycosyltransferase n=1 Tax=Pseudonocardia acidicola TaxID=2724939 RepID=A0ABX1SCZ8_9PSEU|nr:mycofactocin system glycosyltransferase [Pseudonocardia acidicola]